MLARVEKHGVFQLRHVELAVVRRNGISRCAIEHQLMLSNQNDVAGLQRLIGDALVVHERAVGTLEVLENIVVAGPEDAGVMARHGGIVDDDRIVRQPPDRHHQTHRTFFQYSIFKLQDKLRHRALPRVAVSRNS